MARMTTSACGILLAAAGLIASPAPLHAASTAAARDRAAIETLESRFAAAFDAKDVSAIMRVYAPGSRLFVFDVTPPRQHVGWADYRTDWQDTFKATRGPVHLAISHLSVTVVGPVAYGHSIQKARYTRTDGAHEELVVRVTDVYRKIHGRWLIVQEHVSVPVDLDTGKADLLSRR